MQSKISGILLSVLFILLVGANMRAGVLEPSNQPEHQKGSISAQESDTYNPFPETIDNAGDDATNKLIFQKMESHKDSPNCYDDYPPASDFWLDNASRFCSNPQHIPFVEIYEDGKFIVVWQDHRGDTRFYSQRFNPDGTPSECNRNIPISNILASTAGGAKGRKAFAADLKGNFVVTGKIEFSRNIAARYMATDDTPLDSLIYVNDTEAGNRYNSSVAMAADGRFIIVWEDERNSLFDDIYGQLYDKSGTPVGANFKINDDATVSDQWTAAVAMNDLGEFVVVWQDGRNDDLSQGESWNDSTDIYLQLFNSDGLPKGSNIKVNDDGYSSLWRYPDVEYDSDGGVLVVWQDCRNELWHTYAQRFDATGQKVGTNIDLPLNPEPIYGEAIRTAIRKDGGFSLIYVGLDETYNYYETVYLQQFDSDGLSLGSNTSMPMSDNWWLCMTEPAIAIGADDNEIVVWRDSRYGSAGDIMLQCFDPDLHLIGDISMVNVDDANQWWPKASGNGFGRNIAAWYEEFRDTMTYYLYDCIFAQQFTDGEFEGDRMLITTDATPAPIALAINETGASMVCWIKYAYPSYRPYARFMDQYGTIGDTIYRIDTYTGDSANYNTWQLSGSTAANRFLIIWTDYRNDNYDVYGRIFDSQGESIGDDFRIDDAPDISSQFSGGVCGYPDGTFHVSWADERSDNPGIYLRKFDSMGHAMTEGIRLNDNNAGVLRPAVATISEKTGIAVWFDNRDGDRAVYAQLFEESGELIGTNFRVGTAPDVLYNLDLLSVAAMTDGTTLVTWRCIGSATDNYSICATLLNGDGSIIEYNYQISDDMFDQMNQYAPTVAPTQTGFLATWLDSRRDMGYWDVFGRFFDLTPTDISDDQQNEVMPIGHALKQNSPNPFNPNTIIEFTLHKRSHVSLEIFNILGQRVKTLIEENRPAGTYSIIWDGKDQDGDETASGVYFYRIKAGDFCESKKMLLLK